MPFSPNRHLTANVAVCAHPRVTPFGAQTASASPGPPHTTPTSDTHHPPRLPHRAPVFSRILHNQTHPFPGAPGHSDGSKYSPCVRVTMLHLHLCSGTAAHRHTYPSLRCPLPLTTTSHYLPLQLQTTCPHTTIHPLPAGSVASMRPPSVMSVHMERAFRPTPPHWCSERPYLCAQACSHHPSAAPQPQRPSRASFLIFICIESGPANP